MADTALVDRLEDVFDKFYQAGITAESECKEWGSSTLHTQDTLDRLSYRIETALQALRHQETPGALFPALGPALVQFKMGGITYECKRGAFEHARFLRALRYGINGLPEDERGLVKLAPDTWLGEHQDALSCGEP